MTEPKPNFSPAEIMQVAGNGSFHQLRELSTSPGSTERVPTLATRSGASALDPTVVATANSLYLFDLYRTGSGDDGFNASKCTSVLMESAQSMHGAGPTIQDDIDRMVITEDLNGDQICKGGLSKQGVLSFCGSSTAALAINRGVEAICKLLNYVGGDKFLDSVCTQRQLIKRHGG